MMQFECCQCGECCKHINLIPELACFNDGFGTCVYLKDNLCSIYEKRPEVCRVDIMYEKYYADIYSRKEFYHMNQKVCKELIENSIRGK